MRLKRPEGMNIIPFIDIMLVLLTIVLTISTFIQQTHIRIDLPHASTTETLKEKIQHEILLSKDGELYWDEVQVEFNLLKEKVSASSKEDEIILKADTSSSFGRFIEIVDYLKSIAYPHITIMVKKE